MTAVTTGRAAARPYVGTRNWFVIPLVLGEKNPDRKGWQKLRIGLDDVDAYFADAPQNIGLLTGEASGWVVDVDLDAPETRSRYDRFMPATGARFGRASTPVSHLLYRVTGPVKSARFQDPTKKKDDARAMLLELRASNLHTLVPPSIHPSGEQVTWQSDEPPADVDPTDLYAACARCAAAGLLGRHWPATGARQHAALALGGGLLRAGWSEQETETFMRAVAEIAGDDEVDMRVATVHDTAGTLAEGEPATGWNKLAESIDPRVVKVVQKWLGIRDARTDSKTNGSSGSPGPGRDPNQASRLIELARESGMELFHDDDDQSYVSFERDGHLETWPVGSRGVKRYLAFLFYMEDAKAPGQQAIAEALAVLDGEARFAGPARRVGVRVLDHDGAIYLDLGDAD